MENLRTILVANRGEIAVRLVKTARELGIRSITIYSKSDAVSKHVSIADKAVVLRGPDSSVYTDGPQIIDIAKRNNVDAIIPGYGFLSENPAFARACEREGIYFVGPKSETIEAFGIKHVARQLAETAGVPIVPGTKGLVDTVGSAIQQAATVGYPVMLKATAGGGGMGLITCHSEAEVASGFEKATSRGAALFSNPGVFIERYFAKSRHIEVQVFGNGHGDVVHFGERECSIQRRHQKVIEECPSPYVTEHPDLRAKLVEAAVKLAEMVNYESVGTIEYLVDEESQQFFFLEMNTRLQVEHGITEACYGVDLVELMLRQADAGLSGKGGLSRAFLRSLEKQDPVGAAIEARVYAENPVRDFAPSPGLLQLVTWADVPKSRVDTWVYTGCRVGPFYDPLLAKIIVYGSDREEAKSSMKEMLETSRICGPPTNLDYMRSVLRSQSFQDGATTTNFLNTFEYRPTAMEIIKGGSYTLVQDLGRPKVGHGVPRSGTMDPFSLRIANMLVGNDEGVEVLEITLNGPEILFHAPAIIALAGAPIDATIDGKPIPMYTRIQVDTKQTLGLGEVRDNGCRAYLGVYGGFLNVAPTFGSKATSPLVGIGGYQGRQLAPGDLLNIVSQIPDNVRCNVSIPQHLLPTYQGQWTLDAVAGPYASGYLTGNDERMVLETEFKVSHNASRAGIRLIGPAPEWARSNGGDGGSHPSNIQEYGYSTGALNWTGDEPCLLPFDSPDFGGFLSSLVVIKADWWKMGQLRPGATVRFRYVSYDSARAKDREQVKFLDALETALESETWASVAPFTTCIRQLEIQSTAEDATVLWSRAEEPGKPVMEFRQAGDDYLLLEYGDGSFDLNNLCRITLLEERIRCDQNSIIVQNILKATMGCNSLMVHFDSSCITRGDLLSYLLEKERQLGDLTSEKISCRKFRLPIVFDGKAQQAANKRYMETQRPYAPYLPNNMDFVAESNAMTTPELKNMLLTEELIAFNVGFFCGSTVFLPVDPRHRIVCPKKNPSRVYTPEGTVSWGGSCMAIYPVDSPGGFQMLGQTIPYFDFYGYKMGFTKDRPWLYRNFDLISFYEVSEEELEHSMLQYKSGQYEFRSDMVEFDMAAHNEMLRDSQQEVRLIRETREKSRNRMIEAEHQSLKKWRHEKALRTMDAKSIDALLTDSNVSHIEAPLDANVWKILVREGDVLEPGAKALILEAMKMEIAVCVPSGLRKVEILKVLVPQGNPIRAGVKLFLFKEIQSPCL